MAIEISIRAAGKSGKNWKQAIFIHESELAASLVEVRTIIAKQDIEVPHEYRFLSLSGNVIPLAIEETIHLSEVAQVGLSGTKSVFDRPQDPLKSETQDSVDFKIKTSNIPELWIAAQGEFLESSSSNNDDVRNRSNDRENGGTSGHSVTNNGNEHQDANEERPNNMATVHGHLCPWKAFVNFAHNGNSSRNFFKLLFFLVAILFLLLVSLVLTTHVVFGLLSSVTSHPEFHGLISRLRSDSSSTEETTNLRLKVSELELSFKFKFDQLSSKLTELEDLYLNDLAKHKREMSVIKNQNVDNFATKKELSALQAEIKEASKYFEASKKESETVKAVQPEKKKGKKNKEREGL